MDQDVTISELDLDLRELVVPPARGRSARQDVFHSLTRELTEADIALLISTPMGNAQPSLTRIKHSHHQLARLIGEGRTQTETAQICGYSVSRVSILMDDPAFQELVDHYRSQTQEVYINVHERLANLGLDAVMELHERLNDPEAAEFSNKELMDVIEKIMPLAGFGPKSTQVNEFKFSIDGMLNAVKDEVRTRQNGRITTLEARSNQAGTSEDGRPSLSLDIIDAPAEHSSGAAAGSESGGAPVRGPGGEETSLPANENWLS